MRVICLTHGALELVEALGAADAVVAGPDEVTRSAYARAPETDPATVSRQMADALDDRATVIEVDEARLDALAPDLVVTGAPGVCGVTRAGAIALVGRSIDACLEDLRRLGEALEMAGDALVGTLRDRLHALPRSEARVIGLGWGDPPWLVSGLSADLLRSTGATLALGDEGRLVEGRALVEADAHHLFYLPCGYTGEESAEEARALAARPEAQAVGAVARGDFWALAAPRSIVSGVAMAEAVAAALAGRDTAAARISATVPRSPS